MDVKYKLIEEIQIDIDIYKIESEYDGKFIKKIQLINCHLVEFQ